MTENAPARRPGGRSARVRAAVHTAVEELLREHPVSELTVTQVAQRSGVHVGTLYRRWGDLDGLLLDVVTEQVTSQSPMPDTGSLGGDLRAYAHQVAADLSGTQGKLFLRTLVAQRLATDDLPDGTGESRAPALERRYSDLQDLLDRAAARNENPPTLHDVLETIVAPLFAALAFGPDFGTPDPDRLADRAIALSAADPADPSATTPLATPAQA